jgi:uncharacterized delta-60 repeat protein
MSIRMLGWLAIAFAGGALAGTPLPQDGVYDDLFGNYLPGRTLFQGIEDDGEAAYGVHEQPDGRLVLAGAYGAIRLSASGVPDSSFGNNGLGVAGMLAIQPLGLSASYLFPVAIVGQPDGKLVVVGSVEDENGRFVYAACRASADGVPDASYGDNGCATYAVEADRTQYAAAAAVDAQGRVVVGGWGNFSFGQKMVVVRFTTGGTLDQAFGTNGRAVLLRFGEIAGEETSEVLGAITFDANQRILVAGMATLSSDGDFAVARLGAEGRLDTGFGDEGARLVDVMGQHLYDGANAIAVQRSGRIIVGGFAHFSNASEVGMTIVGLTPSGDVDMSFGNSNGEFIVWPYASSAYAQCYGLVIQQDGKIVMIGYTDNPNNFGAAGQDMAIVRLTPNGDALDGTFASFGVFTDGFNLGTESDDFSRFDRLLAATLQGNRIVAVGGARANWPNESFVAIRLTEDNLLADGFEIPFDLP